MMHNFIVKSRPLAVHVYFVNCEFNLPFFDKFHPHNGQLVMESTSVKLSCHKT